MSELKYEFCIVGSTRNRDEILRVCDLFDKLGISCYCFYKNEQNWGYGNVNQTPEEKHRELDTLDLRGEMALKLFHADLEGEKASRNLLLVLPAGKSAHIEAGIAYGLGKRCYAMGKYESTDTLYNIFETIFDDISQLEEFLSGYKTATGVGEK